MHGTPLGGALACDVHGKNHHKDGSISRPVLEFELVTGAGERVVTAGDVAWPSEVEIINPDQVIATLTGADAILDVAQRDPCAIIGVVGQHVLERAEVDALLLGEARAARAFGAVHGVRTRLRRAAPRPPAPRGRARRAAR